MHSVENRIEKYTTIVTEKLEFRLLFTEDPEINRDWAQREEPGGHYGRQSQSYGLRTNPFCQTSLKSLHANVRWKNKNHKQRLARISLLN